MSFSRTVKTGAGLAGGLPMNIKEWKSGQHVKPGRWPDPELMHSVKQAARFRESCKYCLTHKRTCPVCAGVL